MDHLFTVTADVSEQATVLRAVGEIDHESRGVLAAAAEEAITGGRNRIVIDLARVTFCDSGGLSLFVDVHRRATAAGGRLHLAGAQGLVTTVLLATHLDRLIPLHPTADEALRAAQLTA